MVDLSGLLVVSGKPGVYKVLSHRSKGGILVERLEDNKKMPIPHTANISALEDISIYTHGEEVPLGQVMWNIKEKCNDEPCLSGKSERRELFSFFQEVLPDFDEDRVFHSDIKKVVTWYNALQGSGMLKKKEVSTEEKSE